MKNSLLSWLVTVTALSAACAPSTDTTITPPPVESIPHGTLGFHFEARPVVASAIPGDTVRFSVIVFGSDSTITPTASGPGSLKWSTSDPAIGTVDQRGVFVPKSPGRVTILVAMFADTGNFAFTVVPRVATARIVAPTTAGIIGAAFPLIADVRSASGDSLTTDFRNVTWTSSDTNVAVVDSFTTSYNSRDARIFFKKAGTATVTLTAVDERVSTSLVFTATPLAFRNVDVDTDYGYKAYACGLTLSSVLYCWGDNLPDSALVWYGVDRATGARGPAAPTPVPTTLTFDTVAVAFEHACALTASGDAWCWGSNSFGQLGDGTIGSEWTSAPVQVAGGHKFAAIAVGVFRSCGVTAQGDAWCWGNNSGHDEFGNGLIGMTPLPMAAAPGAKLQTLSIARQTTNGGSSCGESLTGVATCWSENGLGQVGIGHESSTPEPPTPVASPEPLVSVMTGGEHACGLTSVGKAYCWGNAYGGALTQPDALVGHPTPEAINSPLLFRSVAPATYHTCSIAMDGTVWCWGASWGTSPVAVSLPSAAAEIRTSWNRDCAVTVQHEAWCWTPSAPTPVRVPGQ